MSPEPDADARLAFFADAARFTQLVGAFVASAPLLVRTDDEVVGKSLFVKGTRPEVGLIERTMAVLRDRKARPANGMLFIDVGANIGTSTIAALTHYPFAGAVACEPEPVNYRLLRANLVLNGLDDRVRTLPVAVSSKVGPQRLLVHPTNSGGHVLEPRDKSLGDSSEVPANGFRIPVERVTLDFLAERGLLDPDSVGLLWVDVQGSEGRVLKGASSLMTRGVPTVLEVHPGLLDVSDGTATLIRILSRDYTHFVDMRKTSLSRRLRYDLRPTREFEPFVEELRTSGRFTDVLVLRTDGAKS